MLVTNGRLGALNKEVAEMEGPSQDDGALITEQIIEELRQEREREEMEEREWDSKDLNANFVDLLLTIEEDVPSGTLSFKFTKSLLKRP